MWKYLFVKTNRLPTSSERNKCGHKSHLNIKLHQQKYLEINQQQKYLEIYQMKVPKFVCIYNDLKILLISTHQMRICIAIINLSFLSILGSGDRKGSPDSGARHKPRNFIVPRPNKHSRGERIPGGQGLYCHLEGWVGCG